MSKQQKQNQLYLLKSDTCNFFRSVFVVIFEDQILSDLRH